MSRTARTIVLLVATLATLALAGCAAKPVTSLATIESEANRTLDKLGRVNPGARDLVGRAHGVLVFPSVYKAGIGIGGEFGDGVLREGGRTTGYYRIVSGSVGFQLGAQKQGQVIAFMDRRALDRFKRSAGWQAGVDGSIVVADLGASGQATTLQQNQPILGFIVGEAGLMYNVSFEGSKIMRIEP
jgi:lipid-binding SYLF domain-containing protein